MYGQTYGFLIAAPAAVLAAILFWFVFDIQQAAYETHRAEVRAEKKQFDVDFSKAFNGQSDEKLKLDYWQQKRTCAR